MTGLKLSFISGPHERVMPLIDGRVRVEGVDDITTTISDPSVTFWRQLTFWEFELSEMSLSSYLIARSKGADMIAVPVSDAQDVRPRPIPVRRGAEPKVSPDDHRLLARARCDANRRQSKKRSKTCLPPAP
jgi:hypothetical protein